VGAKELRPQDVVVLPAEDGSFGELCPQAGTPADAYEWAYWQTKRALAVRFPGVLGEAATLKTEDEEKPEVGQVLDAVRAGIEAMPVGSDEQRVARKWMQEIGEELEPSGKRKWPEMRLAPYGEGKYLLIKRQQKEVAEDWAFETDREDEWVSSGEERMLLSEHTDDVQAAAQWLVRELVPALAGALATAAKLHDCGKADPRFQNYLAGRRWTGGEDQLLAKSGRALAWWKEQEVRRHFDVPEGFRHESLSMQLAEQSEQLAGAPHRDLVMHLIAAHHGFARPLAPVVEDKEPPAVSIFELNLGASERKDHAPHRLDSGMLERFWGLTRQYGWWGLAFLESLLRCADQHASAMAESEVER
jgi:CRISPR-associated endonuclease Cas3-HD